MTEAIIYMINLIQNIKHLIFFIEHSIAQLVHIVLWQMQLKRKLVNKYMKSFTWRFNINNTENLVCNKTHYMHNCNYRPETQKFNAFLAYSCVH